ncbi:MAG: branched-chain amino acid ABC transporter substrate-binding protein [archaeon]
MKKTIAFSILFVLIASIFLFGCAETKPKQETIKIVTGFPMRGITVGQGIVNGIKLALEEVNYTVGNFKIELVVEDDGDETGSWKEDLERGIAERAVSDPDVMLYLGTYNSGAAKISIPINNKGGLVQISPGNTWPGLTQAGFLPGEPGIFYPTGIRNYFRVNPTDALQGPAGVVWAKELGCKNIYIFDDGEAFGTGIANIIQQKASEIGVEVLGRKTLDKTKVNEELAAIKDLHPNAIYFAGITPNGAPELVKGIKELGMDSKFIGPDGIMEQAFIDQSEGAAEGVYITVVGIPPKELTGKGKEFYDRYKQRYNLEPESFSTFGYESAKVALLAIEKAGVKDRAKILEEVSKTKDFSGLFGTWSFDQNGDTSLNFVSGNIVENGTFVFKKILQTK